MKRPLAQAYCRSRLERSRPLTGSMLLAGLSVVTVLFLLPSAPASAQGCSNDALRADAAKRLPDCRAYEMVSPLDKNGAVIDLTKMASPGGPAATMGVAPDGEGVAFPGDGAVFADNESAPAFVSQYLSTRKEGSGWSTRGINPPMVPQANTGLDAPVYLFSKDLSQALVATNALLAPGAELLAGVRRILYRQDNSANPLAHELVSRASGAVTPASENFHVAGATEDFSHVVFSTSYGLTSDAPPSGRGLYEWANGEVRFVARRPDGTPAAGNNGGLPGGRNVFSLQLFPGDHFLSEDGKRIFFADTTGLYVREHGTQTRVVSGSELPPADPNVPTTVVTTDSSNGASLGFQFAKADDGSVAFFTSASRLTTDATATTSAHDLYRWDANKPVGQRLTNVTRPDPGVTLTNGAGMLGVAAATDDARHVYFVARGALTLEAPATSAPKLYLWREDGGLRFIETLDGSPMPGSPATFNDASIVSRSRTVTARRKATYRDARVTADGQRLVFASYAKLTDYDNAGHKAIYLYDAAADEITCVSCSPLTQSSTADAHLQDLTTTNNETRMPATLVQNLSANGRRVVFEADGRLVPEDANGERDVYLWEEGELHLISSARSSAPARLLGASANGDDIFFVTDDPLVGADLDDQPDVYDARAGGGIAAQHPPPSFRCEGDACQGAASGTPLLPALAGGVSGLGDLRPRARPSFSVARLSRAQRRRLARGRRAVMLVRVNRAGRVSLSARAKLGKRMRIVDTDSKAARRAGTVRLSLKLSGPARRALARKDRMRLKLTVRFAGVREARTSSVTLRRAQPSGERSAR